jgi:hypothetical protein
MGVFSTKRVVSFGLTACTVLCLLAASERRAMAYIDPGSGLLALQSAGAFLAAAAFTMRRRILSLFGKGQPAAKKPANSVPLPVAVQKGNTRNAA